MRFLLVFFVLLVSVMSVENLRMRKCPACLDRAYVKFILRHPLLFPEELRQMAWPIHINRFQCKEEKFTTANCENACLRVQLRNTRKDNTVQTLGWLYYCSTEIIMKTPNWLRLPLNLDRYNDDFSYVDHLTSTKSYEVTFYANESNVEMPFDHYFRISGLNKEIDEIKKTFSNEDGVNYHAYFWIIVFIITVLFSLIIFWCAFFKCYCFKPKEKFITALDIYRLTEGVCLDAKDREEGGKMQFLSPASTQKDAPSSDVVTTV